MSFSFVIIFFKKVLLFIPLSFLQFCEHIKNKKNNIIDLKDRYGLYGFVGLAGYGKTISMVYSLYKLRKKYKNNIYIFTNFPCKLSDYVIPVKNGKTDYTCVLGFYDKPIYIGWDEMQNDFPQSNFKDFPQDLLRRLTQLRKRKWYDYILYNTRY